MNSLEVDVRKNRRARKWSRKELLKRVVWAIASVFFKLSPRPFWSWRQWILRRFGAKVGQDVHIYPSVRITIPWNLSLGDGCAIGDRAILYALGPITIGSRATVSQGAHLCAGSHDWRDQRMPLTKPPITIGNDCWIAADAFIGPGVSIGKATIVGARAVVMRNQPDNVIVVGNPATVVKARTLNDDT
ncbi:WcaF family extracellular polysaccharide biosynthesis acetyltransferase [Rhodobacter maris]|uniref:Putative colanic acid biosynthesis acetyltransferase WcaF n=1 Tax=Rhodobacter maris TaxID=446682 RepID=A0A285TE98_9RHOB|nr:WcaF family extracellular polysaccharide biosynthesis acetyltransferase [Rhodobacter maris]SOC20403.1 putative colanic acid biosynthesis acetyltransferase WcaF [Rhodobacter maris]